MPPFSSSSRNGVQAQRRTPYPGSMPRRRSPRSGARRGAWRRSPPLPLPHPPASSPPPSSLRDATSAPTVGWRTRGHPQRPSPKPTKWGEVPSAARRRGGPRCPGTVTAQACLPRHAPLLFVIPERRPSAAQDAVSGIHASPSIPAIRSTTRRVAPVAAAAPAASSSVAAPPPSSLRDATSAPTSWGGGRGATRSAHPPNPRSGGRCRAQRGGGRGHAAPGR